MEKSSDRCFVFDHPIIRAVQIVDDSLAHYWGGEGRGLFCLHHMLY